MIPQGIEKKINQIVILTQLASILEVTARKPGNVSPINDFQDTKYEDFLVGSLAIGEGIKESVKRGFLAGENKIPLSEIEIGELIKKCILEAKHFHRGGNTHMGMVMLMVPTAASMGLCLSKNSHNLQTNINEVIKNATTKDSLNFYEAVKIAEVGGLGGKLKEPKVNFYELMKISSKIDRIAEELVNGLEITFKVSESLQENSPQIYNW